jgi:hypothetical protein
MKMPLTVRKLFCGAGLLPVLLLVVSCAIDTGTPVESVDDGGLHLGPNQGQFFDATVHGLEFVSGDRSGITDENGVFSFQSGENIEFRVGGIVLGSATPARKMNPMHLAETTDAADPVVTNIARFLQTIDNDGNPSNGIRITKAVRAAAAGKTLNFVQEIDAFENDANVQSVIAELTAQTNKGTRSLVDASAAQSALMSGIRNGFMGEYSGGYCEDLPGGGQTKGGQWAMRVARDGSLKIQFVGNVSFIVECQMALDGTILARDPQDDVRVCGLFSPEFNGHWSIGERRGTYSQNSKCSN